MRMHVPRTTTADQQQVGVQYHVAANGLEYTPATILVGLDVYPLCVAVAEAYGDLIPCHQFRLKINIGPYCPVRHMASGCL